MRFNYASRRLAYIVTIVLIVLFGGAFALAKTGHFEPLAKALNIKADTNPPLLYQLKSSNYSGAYMQVGNEFELTSDGGVTPITGYGCVWKDTNQADNGTNGKPNTYNNWVLTKNCDSIVTDYGGYPSPSEPIDQTSSDNICGTWNTKTNVQCPTPPSPSPNRTPHPNSGVNNILKVTLTAPTSVQVNTPYTMTANATGNITQGTLTYFFYCDQGDSNPVAVSSGTNTGMNGTASYTGCPYSTPYVIKHPKVTVEDSTQSSPPPATATAPVNTYAATTPTPTKTPTQTPSPVVQTPAATPTKTISAPAPTFQVKLTASPNQIHNGDTVTLTAGITGSPSGTLNYAFYCHDSDANPVRNWANNSTDACTYPKDKPGTVSAMVKVTDGNGHGITVTAKTPVTILAASASPTATATTSPHACPAGVSALQAADNGCGSNPSTMTAQLEAEKPSVPTNIVEKFKATALIDGKQGPAAGGDVPTYDYSVWYNCSSTSTSVDTVMATCKTPDYKSGAISASALPELIAVPNDPSKFVYPDDDHAPLKHIYVAAGAHTAKVIIEHGDFAPAEARKTITAVQADVSCTVGNAKITGFNGSYTKGADYNGFPTYTANGKVLYFGGTSWVIAIATGTTPPGTVSYTQTAESPGMKFPTGAGWAPNDGITVDCSSGAAPAPTPPVTQTFNVTGQIKATVKITGPLGVVLAKVTALVPNATVNVVDLAGSLVGTAKTNETGTYTVQLPFRADAFKTYKILFIPDPDTKIEGTILGLKFNFSAMFNKEGTGGLLSPQYIKSPAQPVLNGSYVVNENWNKSFNGTGALQGLIGIL